MIKLNRTVEAISKQNKRRQMEETERQREEEWDEETRKVHYLSKPGRWN